MLDKTGLAKDMKLRDQQKVVFAQAVGYPE